MTPALTIDRCRSLVLPAVMAVLGVALLIGIGSSGSIKLIGAVLAGAVVLMAAYLCGNPRLYCLWLLMLSLPFDLSKRFGPQIEKMGGESAFRIELSDPFIIGLALYLIRDLCVGRSRGVRIPKVTFCWALIICGGVATMLTSNWHLTVAHETLRMVKVMILFVVVCNELTTPRKIYHCAMGLTLGVAIQACVGLVQYVTHRNLGLAMFGETSVATVEQLSNSSVAHETVFRISAFLVHPNIFGVYLACLLPMPMALFVLRGRPATKAISLLVVCLGLPALIGTLSRSGWVSLAVAAPVLLILMLLHGRLRRLTILPAATAASIALMVLLSFAGPISRRIFASQEGAMLGRAEYNADAMRLIWAMPWFGSGLNTYVYAIPPYTRWGLRDALSVYQGWIPAVHNIYLLWAAETGLVGFAVFMTMWAGIIWAGLRNLKVRNDVLYCVNAACLAGMAAFAADGFFSFSLRMNSICRIYWVMAGIMLAIHYWHLRDRAELAAAARDARLSGPRAPADDEALPPQAGPEVATP